MGYKDDNYSTKVCGHHPETCTCRDWDTKEEAKQETLEEAVNNFKKTDVYINKIKQVQERMYSEEEVIKALDREEWINLFKNNSKEEILEMLIDYKFPL